MAEDNIDMIKFLGDVNFDWTTRIEDVWNTEYPDVPDIHMNERNKFIQQIELLKRSTENNSPLGLIFSGASGSGKTHLLNAFRHYAINHDIFFILVDLSGVRDFWDTVRLHMLKSLEKPAQGGNSQTQKLLKNIILGSGFKIPDDLDNRCKSKKSLLHLTSSIITKLASKYKTETIIYQDIIRSILLLNSDDFELFNFGWHWLTGLSLESETLKQLQFQSNMCNADDAVKGLSWLMSLGKGTSVIALDQIDAIVKQHALLLDKDVNEEISAQKNASQSILTNIADGLSSLIDHTRRSLTIISCLTQSYNTLTEFAIKSSLARYRSPIILEQLQNSSAAEMLVAKRLKPTFDKNGFIPPYATWPFPTSLFEELEIQPMFPRGLLQVCNNHLEYCRAIGQVIEFDKHPKTKQQSKPSSKSQNIEFRFRTFSRDVDIEKYKLENTEETFWSEALVILAQSFCYETEIPKSSNLLTIPDNNINHKTPLLHVKIHYENINPIFGDRYLGIRALFQIHPISFQNRLKAAMTQSGIDRPLSFRKLCLIRFGPPPRGPKTSELLEKFHNADGKWYKPTDIDIRSIVTLLQMTKEFPADWIQWAKSYKPVTQMKFLKEEFSWLVTQKQNEIIEEVERSEEIQLSAEAEKTSRTIIKSNPKPLERTKPNKPSKREGNDYNINQSIPIGYLLEAGIKSEIISLPIKDLVRHIAIFGGSGSGKTVLIRHLVEEAAIFGIPSIVIDLANDLSRLGLPWPKSSEKFEHEDREKNKKYFSTVEVKIWTPGLEKGNPLSLQQLPDFKSLTDDIDQLNTAISMTVDSFKDILGLKKHDMKTGILTSALNWMAIHGGGDLTDLANILTELPDGAGTEIHANAPKQAATMAGLLKSAMASNPLLQTGTSTDISCLLHAKSGKTLVSVINLSGLGSLESQQIFINQLVMSLFSWIKNNPAKNGPGGLLVIDEAKDFVPAQKTTPCKESVSRFAAQARKYGFGLILATQQPKSVDHNIISNCNSQFFGRQNSPASIEAAEELLEIKGVVGKLSQGIFYVKSEFINKIHKETIKISTPLCLSYHPSSGLLEEDMLDLAAKSRS